MLLNLLTFVLKCILHCHCKADSICQKSFVLSCVFVKQSISLSNKCLFITMSTIYFLMNKYLTMILWYLIRLHPIEAEIWVDFQFLIFHILSLLKHSFSVLLRCIFQLNTIHSACKSAQGNMHLFLIKIFLRFQFKTCYTVSQAGALHFVNCTCPWQF